MATADEYNLESLMDGLLKQNLYTPMEIRSSAKREEFLKLGNFLNDKIIKFFFFQLYSSSGCYTGSSKI